MSRPLSDLRGPVRALFSDVDGTMTTGERIEGSTYEALEQLSASGIPVIMVTGRPAGWGQAFMKMLPVLAVVTENGGRTLVPGGRGPEQPSLEIEPTFPLGILQTDHHIPRLTTITVSRDPKKPSTVTSRISHGMERFGVDSQWRGSNFSRSDPMYAGQVEVVRGLI